jgi:hypothetical protein
MRLLYTHKAQCILSVMRFQSVNMAFAALLTLLASSAFSQINYTANASISASREKAALIYRRLTGVKIHIDSMVLTEMETLISAGKMMEAAQIATSQNAFYNNTVRLMGQKMSIKENTYNAPFSDSSATLMGIVKNNIDARELLTGNYIYAVPTSRGEVTVGVFNELTDVVRSNNHYITLSNLLITNPNINLSESLQQITQKVANNAGALVTNPDPAGIITSRTFMQSCANMGTNRRCYEEVMKKYACVGLEDFSDSNAGDGWVAVDVTRAPGGDPNTYQKTCRGCHGNMDSMRGAFAYFEFDADQIKHKTVNPGALFDANGVAVKYNRGVATGYDGGYRTVDSTWKNSAVTGPVGEFFGWRNGNGASTSTADLRAGLNSFGRMIANSQAFSRCLVKRTYSTLCGRDFVQQEAKTVRDLASEFESPSIGNRKIKWLFEKVATDKSCIGN